MFGILAWLMPKPSNPHFKLIFSYRDSFSNLPVPVTSILWLLGEDVMEWPRDDGALWCMLRYTGGTSSSSSTCIISPPVIPLSCVHHPLYVSLCQNGSYVLPMLWWGSPLKLSCPVQASSPVPSSSHSAPWVFCSPYGMALQMQEQDIQLLGVIGTLV